MNSLIMIYMRKIPCANHYCYDKNDIYIQCLKFLILKCRYHSESGWQVLVEIILDHYGLDVDEAAITIFICSFPVMIDACVKLWVRLMSSFCKLSLPKNISLGTCKYMYQVRYLLKCLLLGNIQFSNWIVYGVLLLCGY